MIRDGSINSTIVKFARKNHPERKMRSLLTRAITPAAGYGARPALSLLAVPFQEGSSGVKARAKRVNPLSAQNRFSIVPF